ncbi:hypothetical protein [Ekhidna sp.]|uniref:hypothetical protein n=1 Tax=Ekhidna sp. TaxID=2608089 RepID=UPI003B58EBDE
MKNVITLLVCLLPVWLTAQSSQFRYQTVLRDNAGEPLANESVSLGTAILQSSANGSVVFQESHSVTSDGQGLVSVFIGSSSSLDAIDWENGPYFLRVSVDGETIGTTQLVSVPYAIYADKAETATAFDYENLTNKPDVSGWDLDVSDDFDGDYESLTNKPTTITAQQQATLGNITVTSATDLDALSADVATNTAKESFPGFGTVPGTALEAGTDIWTQDGNNVFYNTGNVGINVPTTADFGSSSLYVGGGIKYGEYTFATLPAQEEGLFFYIGDLGNGGFGYYDGAGLKFLGTSTVWSESNGDVFADNNVLIGQSLGIGTDIVNGEAFDFATIKLKENNTRILFDDTDAEGGSEPYNDWQLVANSTQNGGGNYFGIEDITAGTLPFAVSAGAPDNSLYLDPSGNIGIGTNAPGARLDVNGTVKAGTFVGDGSGLTGITGGTGGVSNAGSTTISAGTGQIDLQINGVTKMVVANNGNVGIGTTSPGAALEVDGDVKINGGLQVSGNIDVSGQISYATQTETEASTVTKEYDVSTANILTVNVAIGQTVSVSGLTGGVTGQIVTLMNIGQGTLTITHSGTGTYPFLLTGATDASLAASNSITLLFDGTNWFALSIAN